MYKCNVQVSQLSVLSVLYQSRLEVIYQVDTQCSITRWKTKSWKYDAQPCIFDEIQCISSGDEMSNAQYYFSNKMILEDAKVSSFSSDFQTLIKIILIPCTNWVRSLFRRLWIEFFPLFYGAYNSHVAINQQELKSRIQVFLLCMGKGGHLFKYDPQNWNLEMSVFKERGNQSTQWKTSRSQGREPTTNSTHIWHPCWDLNLGHTGGRQLSALTSVPSFFSVISQ